MTPRRPRRELQPPVAQIAAKNVVGRGCGTEEPRVAVDRMPPQRENRADFRCSQRVSRDREKRDSGRCSPLSTGQVRPPVVLLGRDYGFEALPLIQDRGFTKTPGRYGMTLRSPFRKTFAEPGLQSGAAAAIMLKCTKLLILFSG